MNRSSRSSTTILTCRCEMLCRICIVQMQPRKHVVLDHADYTASTRQYELRAGSSIKPQISSDTNAARISNSNVTHLVSCWPPWIAEKGGDIASVFVQGLGLALAPKMCPDQSQTFKEVNNI